MDLVNPPCLRMNRPIFILRIKTTLERYYVVDLGVIHGNGYLKILTHVIKNRWGEGERKDWVERKREGGLGG